MKRFSRKTVTLLALLFLPSALAVAQPPADYADPVAGMEFALIKGGSFVMGDITRNDADAVPPHRVTVGDFYIGRYEVTFAQYDLFCEATGRRKPSDEGWGRGNRPVVNVSWRDAVDFTLWLSRKTGRAFRLPSEAEWEYAARGGTSSRFWWGNQLGGNVANCYDCGSRWDGKTTAPVGSFSPNRHGLYDTAGNVYEWCFDPLHVNYEGAPDSAAPWLFGDISEHIARGGSWYMPARELASSARTWFPTDSGNSYTGFRAAMDK